MTAWLKGAGTKIDCHCYPGVEHSYLEIEVLNMLETVLSHSRVMISLSNRLFLGRRAHKCS